MGEFPKPKKMVCAGEVEQDYSERCPVCGRTKDQLCPFDKLEDKP